MTYEQYKEKRGDLALCKTRWLGQQRPDRPVYWKYWQKKERYKEYKEKYWDKALAFDYRWRLKEDRGKKERRKEYKEYQEKRRDKAKPYLVFLKYKHRYWLEKAMNSPMSTWWWSRKKTY